MFGTQSSNCAIKPQKQKVMVIHSEVRTGLLIMSCNQSTVMYNLMALQLASKWTTRNELWNLPMTIRTELWNSPRIIRKELWNFVTTIRTQLWNSPRIIWNEHPNFPMTIRTELWNFLTTIRTQLWNSPRIIRNELWNFPVTIRTELWNSTKATPGMCTVSPATYAVPAAGHRQTGLPYQQGRIAGTCNTLT